MKVNFLVTSSYETLDWNNVKRTLSFLYISRMSIMSQTFVQIAI